MRCHNMVILCIHFGCRLYIRWHIFRSHAYSCIPHTHTRTQVTCTTSTQTGLCEATIALPREWFAHTENEARVSVDVRLLTSFESPETLGSVSVRPQPMLQFRNDIAVFLPGRPILVSQTFTAQVYAHATYSVATFSMRCAVSSQLAIEQVIVDSSKWLYEIRQQGLTEVGIGAILRDPESASPTLVTENELIYSLQVRVLSSGDSASINCTIFYLSNIFNNKIRPRELVTPVPAMMVDANPTNDPYVGEIVIAQSIPRGLFSFADQNQIVNTAVFNFEPISVGLTHLVAMSTGALMSPSAVQCLTDSEAFSLSPACSEVTLNGSETTGTEMATVFVQADNFSSAISLQVWYPFSGGRIEVVPSTLRAVRAWIAPNSTGQCTQQHQQASIAAYAEFSSGPFSTRFSVSILPLISHLLMASNSSVVEIAGNGTVRPLLPGTSVISASPSITSAEITVLADLVDVPDLDVTIFSGLTLNLPSSPYPPVSAQLASAVIEQEFDSVNSPVFVTVVAVGGTAMAITADLGLELQSLDTNVIQVSGHEISLLGRGSGELLRATWRSVCTDEIIAEGLGSIEVTIPDPIGITAELSSLRITYPGDTAEFAGVPTSATLIISLIFPDGQSRTASSDPRIELDLSQTGGLIILASFDSVLMVSPSESTGTFGTAQITISYSGLLLSATVSVSVVGYQSLQLLSTPHPPFPGSEEVLKTTLNRISGTTQFQQAALELEVILTDNSTLSVTRSPLTLFQLEGTSTSVALSGNIVTAITAPGSFQFQGRFGTEVSTLELTVSNTPVNIVALQNFTLGSDTLTGISGTQGQLRLDAEFSDSTIYPDFVPSAQTIFPSVLALTSNTPTAVAIDASSGVVTLLNNHHSLVTVTAVTSDLRTQTQVSFACNLQPALGDVDIGSDSGVPIPAMQVGDTFSVPLYVETGSQILRTVELVIVYDRELLSFSMLVPGSDWPESDLQHTVTTSSAGLVSILDSLTGVGPSGLVHLATITFTAQSSDTASVSGLVMQLLDSAGAMIGEEPPREFIAGDVSVVISESRRRREAVSEARLRGRRNVPCPATPPCEICPSARETGDVNGDCIFDDSDPVFLLQYHTEELFDFQLPSGSALLTSLVADQVEQLDVDRNTALDPSDAYFLLQANQGLLNFLTAVNVLPVQENPSCSLTINATLLSRGGIPANIQSTAVYFDIALPFDPILINQQIFEVILGSIVTDNKGLTLQGAVIEAFPLEPSVFGVELLTNFTLSDIGVSVIQVTSTDSQTTNPARTRAMFSHPDPPYAYPSSLDLSLLAFTGTSTVLVDGGYNPLTRFNNTLSSGVCLTPPGLPIFNQSLYAVDIPEDTRVDAAVLTVHADSQSDFDVTYSIASGNPNETFAIDATAGEVVVSDTLDFERETSYQLQILATDPATGRSATTTAVIGVLDVNDNAPVFNPVFPVALPDNTPTGSVVARLEATDADSGTNAVLEYAILSDEDTFAIDPSLGIVTLRNPLDFDSQSSYDVMVTTTDQGVPPMSSSVILNVTVLPPDPTILQFTQPIFNISVSEDVSMGYVVLQLEATPVSNDTRDIVIQYFLDSPQDSPFIITPTTGELVVNSSLDRELRVLYELQVSASVTNVVRAIPAVAVVLVELLDINDNNPMFLQESYSATLVENLPQGTLRLLVTATDPDFGVNGTIQYSLLEDSGSDFFTIDTSTGLLSNSRALDFEAVQQLQVTVIASDLGVPPLNSSVNVDISVLDVNDNSPNVLIVPTIVSINESSPAGVSVAMATAEDIDSVAVNGDILFSITPGVAEFSVDASSGEVVTATALDFESVQSYVLTIVATDSGTPPLSSNATLTVLVEDINDNPPIFSEETYSLILNESTPIDSTLLQLEASDADSGPNSDVEFSLISGDTAQVFSLLSDGLLTLANPLDFENASFYSLVVAASNIVAGFDPSVATVNITITDINEFAPEFVQALYQASVVEEITGAFVVQVEAVDRDGTASIVYALDNDAFSITANGTILTSTVLALDRETTPQYVFTVIASDSSQPERTSSALVNVTLIDVNDNAPAIVPFRNLSISETIPVSSTIATFSATDPDSGDNGRIDFSFADEVSDFNLSSSGVLTVAAPLDATVISQYSLEILAQDMGNPPQTSVATIVISVEPSAVPFFDQNTYFGSVAENEPAGSFLVQVSARSRDQTVSISYALSEESSIEFGAVFDVEPDSGNVTAQLSLDREEQEVYTLTVEAIVEVNSTLLTATTMVEISILDRNDNDPVFVNIVSNQSVNIPETTPSGVVVVSLEATDADIGENAIIIYSITTGNEDDLFAINQSGNISTQMSLLSRIGERPIVIQISNPPDVGELSSTADIRIVVTPVNAFAPVFDVPQYSVDIREDSEVGLSLLTVQATDGDVGTAAEVSYAITAGDDGTFTLNSTSGELVLAVSLDFESVVDYNLTIQATDNGMPSLSTEINAQIRVTDFNDHPPIFTQDVYTGSLLENQPADVSIAGVMVTDEDSPLNSQVNFSITFGADAPFSITPSGSILSTEALDRELTPSYNLIVQASNFGSGVLLTATATVEITVLDENDNFPQFSEPAYSRVLQAPVEANTTIVQVQASDNDEGSNGQVRFSLTDPNDTLAIDPLTGVVYVAMEITNEANLSVIITAFDLGTPQLSNQTLLSLTVLPPDDLTAGREEDLVFSADSGISLFASTVEVAADMYQRLFGFAVGRSVLDSRNIAASLGPIRASTTVLPSLLPPSSVQAILLTPDVWHDNQIVQIAAQVRDENHNVQTLSATVTARVTHPSEGSVLGSCSPLIQSGTCIITVSVPSDWFDIASANLTVDYGLSIFSPQPLGTVSLESRPAFDVGSSVYVFTEMPFRPLFRGDVFTANAYGEAGVSGVSSYTVNVQVSNDFTLVGLSVDGDVWLAQTMSAVDGGLTITAIRADQTVTPLAGRVQLFSITAQVTTTSPVDTLLVDAVITTVLFLGDSNRVRVLPPPDVDSTPGFALSRNGITTSGAVYVAEDRPLGLLPYATHAELVNTAVLDGNTVSAPITILGGLRSGRLASLTPASCTAADTTIVDVSPDCSSVLLTPSQTQSTTRADITVRHSDLTAALPVRVWVPNLPLTLAASDTTLNEVPRWFNVSNACSPLRQQATISAFVDFTDSETTVENIDVTDLVSRAFVSTDVSILEVEANKVTGITQGIVQVRVPLPVPESQPAEIEFNVTSAPVEVLGLDVQVVTRLSLDSPPGSINRLSSSPLTIMIEQLFDFEGIQGSVVAAAIFSDGFRMLLTQSDGLTLASLDDNIIQLSSETVTAVGSGQGELVHAIWSSDVLCSSELIATGVGRVVVELPLPTSVNVVLGSSVLTQPGSSADTAGIASSTSLIVIALFADGRNQDLTNDPRTTFAAPPGITIARNGIVTVSIDPSLQTGDYSIQVTFSQFPGLEELITITVVSLDDITISATPSPTYPGSELNEISALHPIASTGIRQQAILTATGLLSNGQTLDISSSPDLWPQLSATPSTLQSATSLSSDRILSISDVSLTGTLTLSATLDAVNSSSPLVISVDSIPVQVSNIVISPFPQDTLRGIIDVATQQVIINVDFNDSTQYIGLFSDQLLPNLVTFSSTPPSALSVDASSGLATLRGNSLSPASITVTSVDSSAEQTLMVSCNLDPAVGDVDLGSQIGVPIPSRTVGLRFSIPVRVNSGSSILDSLELDILSDDSILRAVSASPGPDWPSSGVFQFTVNDPVNIISIGGTLVGSTPVSGSSLYLADVEFEAIAPAAVTDISGVILTLAEQSSGGTAENIIPVPSAFVAGAVQLEVLAAGRRRRRVRNVIHAEKPSLMLSDIHTRQRRQSCASPPCDTCDPARETGDVDGNCVFDVRDASFLQLYYLTTLTTGSPPALPTDRARYLDIDLNGDVDPNDVIFMLRVNFRLLRFVTDINIAMVMDESCEFAINVTLLGRGDVPAEPSSTALAFDLAHEDTTFQAMFDTTNFTTGSVIVANKGPGLFGGLVQAEHLGNGVFGISAQTNINITDFGVSLIQATFDSLGESSSVRTAAMFSQNLPRYSPLDLSLSLQGQEISLQAQMGYSPLILTSNTLTSPVCFLRTLPLVFESPTYTASISEEDAIGTSVLLVQAITNRPGSEVLYSLDISSSLPFSINSLTGEISISDSIDFESQFMYTFTVLASENGLFNASAIVTVIIQNINDLPPAVAPIGVLTIPANRSSGDELFQVNASDPDSLDVLSYSIESSTAAGLLTISGSTGVVTAARSLLDSANTVVELNISVSDSNFTSYAAASLDIFLPAFSEELYLASASELVGIGTSIVTVAVDNSRSETFEFQTLELSFGINQSGVVYVAMELDFESQPSFSFLVIAESDNFVLQTEINITVFDENDNAPNFSQPGYIFMLPSSTPVGTIVGQLLASDRDSGSNAAITYSISQSSTDEIEYFQIDSASGTLSLRSTLLEGPSLINLTAVATDSGQPPLNGSAEVIIEVMSLEVPPFPLPPTVAATGGVFLAGSITRDGSNAFSQGFGTLSSPGGQLSASYGEVAPSSLSLTAAEQSAMTITTGLLHPSSVVYPDRRELTIVAQVRDDNYRTSTASGTTVQIRASLPATGEVTEYSQCSPDPQYGICTLSLLLPEEWFSSLGTVVLDVPLLDGVAIGQPILLTIEQAPSVSSDFENQILVELPVRDVLSGGNVSVSVVGFSTYAISGFSILFTLDPALEVESITIDSTVWSSQTITDANTFGISAILTTPVNEITMTTGPTQLFTLQLRSTASLETSRDAIVTAQVQSLSTVVEGSVLIGSGTSSSGPALLTDRDGLSITGTVHILPDRIVVLLPWIEQTEFLNTVILNGETVTAEIELFAAFASGQVIPYTGEVNCSSTDVSVIAVNPTCSGVVLDGSESGGSDGVEVIFGAEEAVGRLPLRVFYPELPLRFNTSDTTLNRVQFTLNDNCSRVYQESTVSVFVDFATDVQRLSDVVVTDVVLSVLQASGGNVIALSGSSVRGLGPGSASVCVILQDVLGCADFTVVDEAVQIGGISASILVELSIATNRSSVAPGVLETAMVIARSRLEFDRERASVLVAVQYTDGSLAAVDEDELMLQPSPIASIYSVEGNQIIALSTGEDTLTIVWSPQNGQCNLEISETVPVSVFLPLPSAVRTSLLAPPTIHRLTTAGSVAALAGIPTVQSLQVSLEFPDGQTLDVTSDSRIVYSISNDLVAIDDSGMVTATGQGEGPAELTIQFTHTNLTAVIQFVVIQSRELRLSAFPHPPYPGSDTTPIIILSPFENSGVWQQATLSLLLILTNDDSVDVTRFLDSSITVVTVTGTPSPEITNFILNVQGPGFVRVNGDFSTVSTDFLLQVSDTPVTVVSISINPLVSSTLRGVVSSGETQLSADITFSDGSQLLDFPAGSPISIPGLVSYNSSDPAISVMESGLLQPLANSIIPVSVQATAGTGMITALTTFVVNLDPDVGDVDLGQPSGSPLPSASFGDELIIPVVVNSASSSLGAIDIIFSYDPQVLAALDVELGPDWSGGVYESSLNDPPGEIRFGGALSSDGVSGSRLHLFSLRLLVIGTTTETTVGGTVVTIAERNVAGTPIGSPTPRPIIAGAITFSTSPGMNRRSPIMPVMKLTTRYRRTTDECATPPCSCSGQSDGDTDGNCVFDIRDVTYTLIYISESLVGFSRPEGQDILNRTTEAQLQQIDPNRDGSIDTSDAYFLLRAVFQLVYFLQGSVEITPVQATTSNCLFSVQVEFSIGENISSDFTEQAEVFIDVAFDSSDLQNDFDSSTVISGTLVTADKGPGLVGGIIQMIRVSPGVFVAQLNASFMADRIGVSIITATFDASNQTDASRTTQFFGPPPPEYSSPLNLTIPARQSMVQVAASSGYSPFVFADNTLRSQECSDVPLIGSELNVTLQSAFQAVLEWTLLNMRSGLNLTSMIQLYVMNCTVNQSGSTVESSCREQVLQVENDTFHFLAVIPFTDYRFEIRGPTTRSDTVQVLSPEAGLCNYLYVCLSVCLSVCLCLSVCPSVCLSVCLSTDC